MEKRKVIISNACPLQWDTMKSIDNRNKFCGSCKMKVSDFTKETELNTEGTHCGRFRMDQVESINRSFNFNPRQVFVVSLLSLFGMTAPLKAQIKSDTATSDSISSVSKEFMKLKGVVKDKQTGEGIPFANVIIKDGSGGIVSGGATDHDGNFTLAILKEFLEAEDFSVEISVVGYGKANLNLSRGYNVSTSLEFKLEESEEYLHIVGQIYHQPSAPNGTTTFDSEDIRESPYRQ